jgi:hypothetical protein
MDPALSYGLIEFLRMLEVLNGSGVCRWGRQAVEGPRP